MEVGPWVMSMTASVMVEVSSVVMTSSEIAVTTSVETGLRSEWPSSERHAHRWTVSSSWRTLEIDALSKLVKHLHELDSHLIKLRILRELLWKLKSHWP